MIRPIQHYNRALCLRVLCLGFALSSIAGTQSINSITPVSSVCQNDTAFIPNSFTPNDDGKNDVFRPVGLSIESMTFQLFNKWGQKIIEDDNFTQWDGRLNGEMLTNGTYLYQMKFVDEKGRFHFRSGSLYLHR